VFAGVTYTYEDDRLTYDEQRFVTLGLLREVDLDRPHRRRRTPPHHFNAKGNEA
jgi:hypothetical protein